MIPENLAQELVEMFELELSLKVSYAVFFAAQNLYEESI